LITSTKQTSGIASCFIVLFLIFGSRGFSFAQLQPQVDLSKKNVLILHSFGYAQPAYKIIDASLQEAFVWSGLDFNNLYFEFLDLARNSGQEYRDEAAEIFRKKFKDRKLDLVLTLHQEALQFLLKEGRDVYPEGPIISVLGDADFFEYSDPKRPLVHLPFTIDVIATAREMFRLQPDTRRILVIAGSSALDRRFDALVMTRLRVWKPELNVESMPPLSMDEILKKVASLPTGTAILYTTVYADSTGKTYMPTDAARMICARANAPVFGMFETLLGNNGIVGGIILDHRVEGQRAVRIAMDILQGNLPNDPFTVHQAPLIPMFDWQQLKRWGFDDAKLPPGSIVLNKPVSLWDQHKIAILGVLAFILLESVLIIFLFIQIHRKKIAEQSLKKAEEKYRSIFEGALEGIFESTPEGRLLTANAALSRMLGYDSPEELTSSIRDLGKEIWLNDRERAEHIQRLEKEGIILNYECQFQRRDESPIWVSLNTRRIAGPDGQTLFYSGFMEDITERKRAEGALEERLRFERLLSDISARFVNISPEQVDGEIENALRMVLEFFQVDRCALLQILPDKTFWRITHATAAEDTPSVPVGMQLSVTETNPWSYDKLILKREVLNLSNLDDLPAEANVDKQTWIVWGIRSNLNIPIIVDRPVSYIFAINTIKRERVWPGEIIPRLRLLGEILVNTLRRKQTEEANRESEAKYRSLYDSMMDGYVLVGVDGKILSYNEAYREMTGYSSDELLKLTYSDITPEKWHAVEKEIIDEQVLTRGYSEVYEKEYRKKDGTVLHVELRTFLLRDERGNNVGIWAIIRDITGRKQMESEARRLKDDLAHVTRVSTLGGLTGALAHEINQPLAAILSNAQAAQRFLSQDNPDMKEIREILGDIIRDNNRAAEVIRKIRSLLKKEETRYETLSLNDVIEEIINVIRNDTALTAVSIEREFDPSLPAIWGDRIQLQQVILNLVMNAAEAMRDVSPDLQRLIVKTTRQDDGFAKVSVRDFGLGIQVDVPQKLFHAFYTTKSGGMGMGLAISQDIIKAHRGVIWGENNTDTGATFSFTVPFDKGERS